jgi:hypothetical protein
MLCIRIRIRIMVTKDDNLDLLRSLGTAKEAY